MIGRFLLAGDEQNGESMLGYGCIQNSLVPIPLEYNFVQLASRPAEAIAWVFKKKNGH